MKIMIHILPTKITILTHILPITYKYNKHMFGMVLNKNELPSKQLNTLKKI